jgi:ABC-type multidrug transport system ATPase subunit
MPAAALRVTDLKKSYKDVTAVNGLDLEVYPGECFGLLGPNGAGKTTTIEICEGLTEPDSGDVEVLGLHWKTDARELRQRLGIQLRRRSFPTNSLSGKLRSFFGASFALDPVQRTRSRLCSFRRSAMLASATSLAGKSSGSRWHVP